MTKLLEKRFFLHTGFTETLRPLHMARDREPLPVCVVYVNGNI